MVGPRTSDIRCVVPELVKRGLTCLTIDSPKLAVYVDSGPLNNCLKQERTVPVSETFKEIHRKNHLNFVI